jgi:hypothetical protein
MWPSAINLRAGLVPDSFFFSSVFLILELRTHVLIGCGVAYPREASRSSKHV